MWKTMWKSLHKILKKKLLTIFNRIVETGDLSNRTKCGKKLENYTLIIYSFTLKH